MSIPHKDADFEDLSEEGVLDEGVAGPPHDLHRLGEELDDARLRPVAIPERVVGLDHASLGVVLLEGLLVEQGDEKVLGQSQRFLHLGSWS